MTENDKCIDGHEHIDICWFDPIKSWVIVAHCVACQREERYGD